MGNKTGIEWTHLFDENGKLISKGATWNTTTGCDKVFFCGNCHTQLYPPLVSCPLCKKDTHTVKPVVDPACDRCYMFGQVKWLKGMGVAKFQKGSKFTVHSDALNIPLKWKKGRKIFVDSLSDVWHPEMPPDFVRAMFEVMYKANHHTYLILTKRTQRMLEQANWFKWQPHIWLGVSIATSNELFRLDDLLKTDAHVKFVSAEPLKDDIDFTPYFEQLEHPERFWMITGGESSQPPKYESKPVNLDYIRKIRDDCEQFGVPFFYKQQGGTRKKCECCGAKGCRVLDGKQHSSSPDMQIVKKVGLFQHLDVS